MTKLSGRRLFEAAKPIRAAGLRQLRPITRPRRPRRTRAEKTEETFRKLILAATDVIGEHGYSGATIARITMQADLAVGTFYTYFESRQDLFDKLLPLVGDDMLDHLRARVLAGRSLLEREELGFRALLDYYQQHPGLYRLLNEAESVAPKAHEAHFRNLARRYVRALRSGLEEGELPGYEEHELEALAYMLMAMRNYLMMRYGRSGRATKKIPDWLVETYMKFVRGALTSRAEPAGRTARDQARSK